MHISPPSTFSRGLDLQFSSTLTEIIAPVPSHRSTHIHNNCVRTYVFCLFAGLVATLTDGWLLMVVGRCLLRRTCAESICYALRQTATQPLERVHEHLSSRLLLLSYLLYATVRECVRSLRVCMVSNNATASIEAYPTKFLPPRSLGPRGLVWRAGITCIDIAVLNDPHPDTCGACSQYPIRVICSRHGFVERELDHFPLALVMLDTEAIVCTNRPLVCFQPTARSVCVCNLAYTRDVLAVGYRLPPTVVTVLYFFLIRRVCRSSSEILEIRQDTPARKKSRSCCMDAAPTCVLPEAVPRHWFITI